MARAWGLVVSAALAALVPTAACSDDPETTPTPTDGGTPTDTGATTDSGTTASTELGRSVLKQYAANVRAGYGTSLDKVKALKAAIDTFLTTPSVANLDAAKAAWVAARDPYGRTEAFRFYGGPIDDEKEGPEARINGWPLDENVIDYTKDSATAGIINDASKTISVELIRDENEKGGEKNITAGFHAIEFLLWGQDTVDTAGGQRPYTDYLTTGGTAANQDRRRAYLSAVTALLIQDLETVYKAWDPADPNSYGSKFVTQSDKDGFEKMLTGAAALAGIELSRERLNNAFETQDQEEEHSCFSDNTKADLLGNAKGIEDVYLGRGATDGPGLDDMVKAKDPALDTKIKTAIAEAVAACEAIPAPFDKAIADAAGRTKIQDAINKTKLASDALLEAGKLYDLRIVLEL